LVRWSCLRGTCHLLVKRNSDAWWKMQVAWAGVGRWAASYLVFLARPGRICARLRVES
jgi:hypothetical protein